VETITGALKYLAELLVDWPIGTIWAVLCLSVLVGILYVVGSVLFYVLDSSFRPRLQCSGQIRQKTYTPEKTTTSGAYSGLDFTEVTTTVPASYRLLIQTDAGCAWESVDSAFYDSVYIDSPINVLYCTGRFSNKVYIRRFGRVL
jgi:hypothetical protein